MCLYSLRPSIWTSAFFPVVRRNLSSSETATALRPFFFAVHPDLFGRFPEQRAVNEDSLKKLNQYIDVLRTNARAIPTQLTFFVRDTKTKPKIKRVPQTLREVRISLLSDCPRETVKTVLRSCNLSLDYVEKVKTAQGFPKSIRWENGSYPVGGVPSPFTSEKVTPKPQVTLDIWLSKNIKVARERQQALTPVEDQIEVLKNRLVEEHGIREVRWENSWGMVQYRAGLLSLLRLLQVHGTDKLHLKGEGVVFGTETGLCLRGDVVLRIDDVQDHWVQVLRTLPEHKAFLGKIPGTERHLSKLLNNIQIVHHRKVGNRLVGSYLSQVRKLTHSIEQHLLSDPDAGFDQCLKDVELVIECAGGRLTVSPEGQILVPHWSPGFLVLDFLVNNVHVARDKKQAFLSQKESTKQTLEQVKEELELKALCRDDNVSQEQLLNCSQRLLENSDNIGISLKGCKLCVAQFYSVMSDGEICIPWNWKAAFE